MTTSLKKFQSLLRDLFQFDSADLDFGIYRIMNHKRQVIERFIAQDLPQEIAKELSEGALAEQGQAREALQAARQKVLDALGEDALDASGDLVEKYRETKAGKEYLEAQAKAQGARSTEALEAAIYNHLYAFFSRYWQDGDFISKRRYSKKERYAIPYNGEEVALYWANHDQYYVKTGEYFTDYTYQAPNGVTVHFKLQQANVEQNNVKGEKRFFLPVLDGIAWDEKARVLTIPFEFRPLTAQETIAYGQKNQQEAIIAKAVTDIPKRVKAAEALAALTAERRSPTPAPSPKGRGEDITLLEYHLRQYTRRNTSDFFIHKDLRGFLSRELDFYLKNEVLNLEELEAAGEHVAEGWFQLLRLIKRVGLAIIDFLAQIEDFQKMLWEKKKFVTETFYVITVGNIPEAFYPEIAACDAQWEEWKALLAVEKPKAAKKRTELLQAHPTLPLDTRHFPQDFTDRLLASFSDPSQGSGQGLDEMTDGLLVNSENWQALNLLQEKYRERVRCIYIDPPFNSPSTEILYKNDYPHSSWLTLMQNRIVITRTYLDEGVYVIAIDENEQERLGMLIRSTWLLDYKIVCVSIRHNPRGIQGRNFSYCHEYAYFIYPSDERKYIGNSKRKETDIRNLRDSGTESDRADARNCFYPIIIMNGQIVGFGEVADDNYHPKGSNEMLPDGQVLVWPVDTSGREKKWRYARQSVEQILDNLEVRETRGKYEIYFAKDVGTVRTIWDDAKFDASEYGTKLLQQIFGTKDIDFSFPKSLYTLIETIRITTPKRNLILDYFAGSGTTGHAVINLNREDGGQRKFILVEMAHYFDTVLLPRIKKVTFSPEWKDGKPKRTATAEEAARSPRIVKVIRLESYEDALNNLTFDDESGQQALELFKDEYLLRYMLTWETRHSETLLDVEQLQTPFAYKLRIHRDGETRERLVDLPETFSYLLGLDVQTRQVLPSPHGRGAGGEGRYLVYRGALRNGRSVAVIWRETKGWTQDDYARDRDFVSAQKLADGADEIFVNGDSLIPGAQSLDPIFKERMFAGVEG